MAGDARGSGVDDLRVGIPGIPSDTERAVGETVDSFFPRFDAAIVRLPDAALAQGLARHDLGVPSIARALEQHACYRRALAACGLAVTVLPADPGHPDATFIEDTAVIVDGDALMTRPGAPSRLGEVAAIEAALRSAGFAPAAIEAPGTLDGGDVCEAGGHVFVGISARTNAAGAEQLAAWLAARGIGCTAIDIRAREDILHLKSGLAWLGGHRLLAIDGLAAVLARSGYDLVKVDDDEQYAANAVRVNDVVLIASGYPRLERRLAELGYRTLALDMTEFARVDGGLSCLSLRFRRKRT